jgi:hypothetical protein
VLLAACTWCKLSAPGSYLQAIIHAMTDFFKPPLHWDLQDGAALMHLQRAPARHLQVYCSSCCSN